MTGRPSGARPAVRWIRARVSRRPRRRELREETGFDLDPGPCVDIRHVSFTTIEGVDVDAEERYYAGRVPHGEIDTGGHTALEQQVMQSHRWWTPQELAGQRRSLVSQGSDSALAAHAARGGRLSEAAALIAGWRDHLALEKRASGAHGARLCDDRRAAARLDGRDGRAGARQERAGQADDAAICGPISRRARADGHRQCVGLA